MDGQRRGGRGYNSGPGRNPPGAPPPPPPKSLNQEPIDREKVGGHHSNEEFSVRGKEPKDEVQIYTWKDATLRELTDLVKEVAPEARRRDATLSFAFVYPSKTGRLVVREVGRTSSVPNPRRPDDSKLALRDVDFEIGDYLDVAIL
uniref:Histone deacetylase complex subunit SAP18 n=1 Tax=Daucus carota subsp. sativus TaxID=79200 RepID=A0A166E3S0_DAUCS